VDEPGEHLFVADVEQIDVELGADLVDFDFGHGDRPSPAVGVCKVGHWWVWWQGGGGSGQVSAWSLVSACDHPAVRRAPPRRILTLISCTLPCLSRNFWER